MVPGTMCPLYVRSKVYMAPFHVQSKVCIAPIHVQSKVCKFAPHMDGSNADFANFQRELFKATNLLGGWGLPLNCEEIYFAKCIWPNKLG